MVEVVYHETVLRHLRLDISLLSNELPELAGVARPRNSASEADDDGGVLLMTADVGRHFGRSLFK